MSHHQRNSLRSHEERISLDFLPRLRAHCSAAGIHAYLLGGFVRDALLGRVTRDIDIAVTHGAKALARDIARTLGGTPVALDRERAIHRIDGIPADGEMWRVDIATLQGGEIEEDLCLRDFTIDAIAVPLAGTATPVNEWPLIDPTGGVEDLRVGVVHMTSPSVLADDPLRLLRAVRIAAQTGFEIEEKTKQPCASRLLCSPPSLPSVYGKSS
jgi:tRNA nucleotidyltransferase/poly(A) polymerase